METLNRFGPLLGRLLIAFIFLFAGFGKITGFEGTVGYIASKGLPLPELGAIGATVVEIGGSLLLIVGWNTRLAAAALFVFTAMTALFFHNFWALPADQAQGQMIHFMKNMAMMGGLLYVVVHGSGPISLDSRQKK
ncbi:DoxX family protein [Candidatus Ferrigenium straubiae]|jgi:putative oxidoreductase|uniref:DoxX family protein n=1 Tax=Candidatus Ferrigenium straubiae TaxID=2919506 RepID=UPI003F4AA802